MKSSPAWRGGVYIYANAVYMYSTFTLATLCINIILKNDNDDDDDGDDGDDVNDVLDKRKLSRRPHAQEEDKKIRENQDKRVRKAG